MGEGEQRGKCHLDWRRGRNGLVCFVLAASCSIEDAVGVWYIILEKFDHLSPCNLQAAISWTNKKKIYHRRTF